MATSAVPSLGMLRDYLGGSDKWGAIFGGDDLDDTIIDATDQLDWSQFAIDEDASIETEVGDYADEVTYAGSIEEPPSTFSEVEMPSDVYDIDDINTSGAGIGADMNVGVSMTVTRKNNEDPVIKREGIVITDSGEYKTVPLKDDDDLKHFVENISGLSVKKGGQDSIITDMIEEGSESVVKRQSDMDLITDITGYRLMEPEDNLITNED